MSDPRREISRRALLKEGGGSMLGALAFDLLRGREASAQHPVRPELPHFKPRVKRVIFLTQSGGPSQIELFDPKPGLDQLAGQELPESVRGGQRVTGMTAGKPQLVLPSKAKFQRRGECGMELSEWLPFLGGIADDLCLVRSMTTDQINHAPAMTRFLTGHQLPGRPSLGSWVSYGLGSENKDLPDYVALLSKLKRGSDQPLYDHYWGNGFLPSIHQGVKLRAGLEPVLYLDDPDGLSRGLRRKQLDGLAELNRRHLEETGDPETLTRIEQYEMAFRMQASVPDLTDLSDEPEETFELYGPDSRRPGTYASNCILARRMAERGVRFVQLFHPDWDHHSRLTSWCTQRCRDTDQASAALITDLKRRGLLDDTLVVWGGEFGRSVAGQGNWQSLEAGRDHHPRCFSVLLAGGGIKGGTVHGATDDFSFNVAEDPVQVRDLHATILHLLGIEHERFTYRSQGLDMRLTGVERARVVHALLS
ncbi:MAG: hypothetical protein ACI8QC_002257 [Planctomycetota bacterium]|jgi:hypothetical protein